MCAPVLASPLEVEVRLALAGDRSARERLLKAVKPLVERQLVRYRLAPEERRDVVQNVLFCVHRRLGDFRGDARFTTWLFRVTMNEALMSLRKARNRRAALEQVWDFDLDEMPAPQPTDAHDEQPDDEVLRRAVAALPEHYRHVVEAHYARDEALGHIARGLCLSEPTVRSRLHRARAALRSSLTSEPTYQRTNRVSA